MSAWIEIKRLKPASIAFRVALRVSAWIEIPNRFANLNISSSVELRVSAWIEISRYQETQQTLSCHKVVTLCRSAQIEISLYELLSICKNHNALVYAIVH